MNWFQFGRLIHSIYSRGNELPDLERIQSLGLLAVKLGQVHALRIDLLERAKCEHLAKLYRRNAALPADDFLALIDRCGIGGFRDAFSDISHRPLASASVGQVHRATLRNGRDVVIKAVKADVRDQFRADVASLRKLFRLAGSVYPPLRRVGDPVAILDDLEEMTANDLDLENELAGAARLAAIRDSASAGFDLSRLAFPKIHRQLTNGNIMVSDFVDAPTVDELLEQGRMDYDVLLELFRVHGFFMFNVGTFHGDLHPGNVLIRDDGFVFIDTGYVASVGGELRRGLFDFFEALTRYEYPACARALHSMSQTRLKRDAGQAFEKAFLDLYSDFRGATVAEISLTTRMMQTIRLAVRAGMSFEKSIYGIIRSLMYLDGMVLRCNPDAVLMQDMRPIIEEFRSAQL
mgnify:CR=1 FL=1